MTIPLPKIPSAEIPLPYQGEGYPPFANIPAGTFPTARRWRVLFRSTGTLSASLLIPSVAHYFSEGVLDTPTRVINRSLFDSEGFLDAHAQAAHSPIYTSEGFLAMEAVSRTTYTFESEGFLDTTTQVAGTAGFNSDSILDLTPVSIAKAEFSGGSHLVFGGGASPATDFSGGGELFADSGIGAGANFSGAGEITTTQLTNIDAKWMSVGTLGAGAYEIEILMEPNFTSEGVVSAKPQPKDSSAGGGEGTLGVSALAKSPAALQGGGSLAMSAPLVKFLRPATFVGTGTSEIDVKVLGFVRQRMNLTSNWTQSSGSNHPGLNLVTSFASDSTYPAVVSGGVITVTGDGNANITVYTVGTGSIFTAKYLVTVNGVTIGTGESNKQSSTKSDVFNVNLLSGDKVALYYEDTSAVDGDLRVGTYVDINPTSA